MQFGLSFLPDCSPESKSAQQFYADALELSIQADQSGLNTIKITEHYLNPYGGYCPNPLTFLTAVAMKTRHVRLMTGGIIAAFHHPVQLASEIAMVDNLSAGRLDIGFVRGYLPYEFDAFGISLDESRSRYEATIQAVDRLLSGSNISFKTPFFEIKNATILPRPIQYPKPPIWCAATSSKESFLWASEQKYDLLVVFTFTPLQDLVHKISWYRKQHPAGKVTVFIPLVIDLDHQKAISLGRHYLERYHQVWGSATKFWENRSSKDYDNMYKGMANLLTMANYDFMNAIGSVFFGCPSYIIDKIHWLQEVLLPNQILWNLDIGAMPLSVSKNTLNLFVDKVLPNL